MKIFVPREEQAEETRVPILPETVAALVNAGADLEVENEIGQAIQIKDTLYEDAGATISADRHRSLQHADMILRLGKPPVDEITLMKKGAIHISQLDPFFEPELTSKLAAQGVTAICMEMIPRTTLAQKMDALSSQANIAGYAAVVIAAERIGKLMPMMMTPAGTINPARVFVIGAGVAGLQAIATAKRLGARVEAFDTRPVVEEQVQSLGAKFVKIDLGETGQTKNGYARKLTEEQVAKQREGMAKHCALADVVITTAKLFGKKAPLIITRKMIEGMRPGSLIVDLAVETGGNVEGSQPGQEIEINGVRIIGLRNLPGQYPLDASLMYSNNLGNLVSHFWDKEEKTFKLDLADEILAGCVLTHDGKIVHEGVRAHIEEAE